MNAMAKIRKTVFNMPQAAFADAVGVNQSTISRWESGHLHPGRPEMEAIRELAAGLDVLWSDSWFFDTQPGA